MLDMARTTEMLLTLTQSMFLLYGPPVVVLAEEAVRQSGALRGAGNAGGEGAATTGTIPTITVRSSYPVRRVALLFKSGKTRLKIALSGENVVLRQNSK